MKSKKYFIFEKKDGNEILKKLVEKFGLPKIIPNLALYAKKDDVFFEMNFENEKCTFRSHNKTSQRDSKYLEVFNSIPPIKIENTNIKFLLKLLKDFNLNKAYIGEEVFKIEFHSNNFPLITIKENTLIGNIITTYNGISIKDILSNSINLKSIVPDRIDDIVAKNNELENIFDNNGSLNSKITRYSNMYGIDLGSLGKTSIKLKSNFKSNDYSYYEHYFERIFNVNFQKKILYSKKNEKYFKPLSIIIPSYKSTESLIKTLFSIQSQNLSSLNKKRIQVIVIDDGNMNPIENEIKKYIDKFTFDLEVIRNNRNMGRSHSRNIGASNSRHDSLVFIDSDILLPKNYLFTHSILNQLFPNSIFMCLKKNVDSDIFTQKNILNGLISPEKYDDKRIIKHFKGNVFNNEGSDSSTLFEILGDTDNLKLFGNGREINGYDLSSSVISHNFSINKKLFYDSGKFNVEFHGWGLEDTFFGACAISQGAFIVPILSAGVYHIKHKPTSINQSEELRENIKKYQELINKELEYE